MSQSTNPTNESTKTRSVLRLEPRNEIYEAFHKIQVALGHEEPEETFNKLVEFGQKAIALTSMDSKRIVMSNPDNDQQAGVRVE